MSNDNAKKLVAEAAEAVEEILATMRAVRGDKYASAVAITARCGQLLMVISMAHDHLEKHCDEFDAKTANAIAMEMVSAINIGALKMAGIEERDIDGISRDAELLSKRTMVAVK